MLRLSSSRSRTQYTTSTLRVLLSQTRFRIWLSLSCQLHWVVTGLSYALTAVGFYLLYELFAESQFDTRAVGALVAVTALPVIFDLFSYTSSLVLSLNYEPSVLRSLQWVCSIFNQRESRRSRRA